MFLVLDMEIEVKKKRLIDAQWATSKNMYLIQWIVVTIQCFELNFADGRIKGYPLTAKG